MLAGVDLRNVPLGCAVLQQTGDRPMHRATEILALILLLGCESGDREGRFVQPSPTNVEGSSSRTEAILRQKSTEPAQNAFADRALAAELHQEWDALLRAFVNDDGWIDYAGLGSTGLPRLKSYLSTLSDTDTSSLDGGTVEKAFWLNAYNALCVQVLIDHKLPDEVPHAALFGTNIFTQRIYRVAGELRSLDDIEHGILREKFDDPRIHAAVVCGASSCPRLRPEAYVGPRLDEQLDEECRRWVRSERDLSGERKNRLDRERKTFYASKILYWYQEDFGDSEDGVLKFVARFSSSDDREFLRAEGVRIEYLEYDWRLNSQ